MKNILICTLLASTCLASNASAQLNSSLSGFTRLGLSQAMCTYMVTGTITHNLESLTTETQLQEMIDVLGAECELTTAPKAVSATPVLYVVEGTEIAFLNDGQSVSFGSQALAAQEMGLLASSTRIVRIPVMKTANLQLPSVMTPPLTAPTAQIATNVNQTTVTSNITIESTNEGGFVSRIKNRLAEIYREGQNEVYISGIAYHDRRTYTPEKVAELNEQAYGFGIGRSVINSSGNYESVYAMGFMDSHNDPQLNVGYMWQKIFHLGRNSSVGIGFTGGMISRSDILKGFPIPFAMPTASLTVGKVSLMSVIIPKLNGGLNHGNVVFLFVKVPVDSVGNPSLIPF